MTSVKYIRARALADLLRAAPSGNAPDVPGLVVIDVRDEDFVGGHIAGARNVPAANVKRDPAALARSLWPASRVVFHCALSQVRGPKAAARFADAVVRLRAGGDGGLLGKDAGSGPEVFVLEGGFHEFAKEMWPTHKHLFADFDEKFHAAEWANN
jgi:rhodanese-related sulfurtransferase